MAQTDKTHEPSKSQVPGQLLGYGLQYSRMLSLLLESDGDAVVSLEVFEDVGVEGDGGTLASQTKSSITKNPVSNGAEPLWKTLRNWLDAIRTGQLLLNETVFELYVFGEYEGEICTCFSNAQSESEANEALSKARKLLSAGGKALPEHIAAVLNGDQPVLVELIRRFRYRHGSGASVSDLKEQLEKTLIPPELVDNVLSHAVGWVKQEIDRQLERGERASIRVSKFREELAAYTRSLAFSTCLADIAGPARQDDIEKSLSRHYVRQLDLILVTDERKLGAISAYLRASVNREEWGRLGFVHERSLDDFENRLTDYWRNSRMQCEIAMVSRHAVERGQYLLAECMKCNSPLQGRAVPHDFIEGCFHSLADELLVGWHPDYETLTLGWK